jgi:hypothetical protein
MNADGTNPVQLTSDPLSLTFFVSWQPVITVVPDPPTPTPTPSVAPAADTADAATLADELPAAGPGGMAGGYAGAMAAYGAYRAVKRRRQWDIQRPRR